MTSVRNSACGGDRTDQRRTSRTSSAGEEAAVALALWDTPMCCSCNDARPRAGAATCALRMYPCPAPIVAWRRSSRSSRQLVDVLGARWRRRQGGRTPTSNVLIMVLGRHRRDEHLNLGRWSWAPQVLISKSAGPMPAICNTRPPLSRRWPRMITARPGRPPVALGGPPEASRNAPPAGRRQRGGRSRTWSIARRRPSAGPAAARHGVRAVEARCLGAPCPGPDAEREACSIIGGGAAFLAAFGGRTCALVAVAQPARRGHRASRRAPDDPRGQAPTWW